MRTYNSLRDVIETFSNCTDKGIMFIESNSSEDFLSYRELYHMSLETLGALQSCGLDRHDELVFQIFDNKTFVVFFWACILGGIVPVPLTAGKTEEHVLKLSLVWKILNNPYLVTDSGSIDFSDYQTGDDKNRIIFADDLEILKRKGEVIWPEYDDIAFVQFSSGSTGEPKGVILTHENLLINISAIIACGEISEHDSTLSWLPLTHDMGLIGFHLVPLFIGFNQYIMPPELFIRNPFLWIKKTSEYGISLISSPDFGLRHFLNFTSMGKTAESSLNLSCVRLVFVGAEMISKDVCLKFLSSLKDSGLGENTLFTVYGLAEAVLAVTFPVPGTPVAGISVSREYSGIGDLIEITGHDDGTEFVKLGFPVNGCSVRICDSDDNPLSENMMGLIQIKGRNVTKGYYNNPVATVESFAGDSWFRTGDTGFINRGQLVVTGREKETLILNGQNYFAFDLERVVSELEGFRAGKVVFCSSFNTERQFDEVVCFIEHKGKPEFLLPGIDRLRTHLRKKIYIDFDTVVPVKQIPKTTSGKIQRSRLKTLYLKGVFNDVAIHVQKLFDENQHLNEKGDPESVAARLIDMVKTVLGAENISGDTGFIELGGNSLQMLQLLNAVYRNFSVRISLERLYEFSTINDIAAYISSSRRDVFEHIKAAPVREYYPASAVQKRIYAIHGTEIESISYNIPAAFKITGDPDIHHLMDILMFLADRHESLRTSFHIIENEIVQKIHERIDFEIIRMQLNSDETVDSRLRKFIDPFDLSEAPLFRTGLLETVGGEKFLVLDFHHIIIDGFSIGILAGELAELLRGNDLDAVRISYKDYSEWQKTLPGTEKFAAQKRFWLESLSGGLPALNFPYDFKRPLKKTYEGSQEIVEIDSRLTAELYILASANRATLFMVLLSAYYVLLYKYTGQDDIIVGNAAAGRTHIDTEGIVGMFVNTLALRNFMSSTMSFSAFLSELRLNVLRSMENQDYPFDDLVDSLDMENDPGRNPVFDTMFVMENMSIPEIASNRFSLKRYDFDTGISDFDFSMIAEESAGKIILKMPYSTKLLRPETVKDLLRRYRIILETAVNTGGNILIGKIEFLTGDDRKRILNDFNNTFTCEINETVHGVFEKQVEKTPEAVAIQFATEKLTYSELNRKVNRFAAFLAQKGVGPENPVGLMSDKSAGFIVALLAIFKAGGVYVPIDHNLPPDRISYILNDCGIDLLVAHDDLSQFQHPQNVEFITLSAVEREAVSYPSENYDSGVADGNLAYIIYTSGSTGVPKGVMIEHRSIVNLGFSVQRKMFLKEGDRVLQAAAIGFDVSIGEIVMTLFTGATLVLVAQERMLSSETVESILLDERISIVSFTPTLLSELAGPFPDLHTVIVGGEVCSPDLARNWARNRRFFNEYGPTESAVVSTIYPLEGSIFLTLPIGKPIDNTEIYILDRDMMLCPPGINGEIYIGGIGLARGYLNQPELTSKSFIMTEIPGIGMKRLYRTGDFGHFLADGNIIFSGRRDEQVKLRGYRIELHEIEYVMQDFPGVSRAVVIVTESREEQFLTAYYTGDCHDISAMRSFLMARLPYYMVPSNFIRVESIPVTSSGKTDNRALRKMLPGDVSAGMNKKRPENKIQKTLCSIWEEVLDREDIGINEDFFALGGHSLKATQVISRINNSFGIDMQLRTIFDCNTVEKIAMRVDSLLSSGEKNLGPVLKLNRLSENIPLSFSQERMWFLNRLDPEGVAYNMPFIFRVKSRLDYEAVKKTVILLTERHESLRTTFALFEGRPVQNVSESMDQDFSIIDMKNTPESDRDAAAREFLLKEIGGVFDLEKGPLLRIRLLAFDDNDTVVMINMHHIISDQWSFAILIYEFNEIYNSMVYNTRTDLKTLSIQYPDYALWQREWLDSDVIEQQLVFWKKQLEGFTILELPTDRPRPQIVTSSGAYEIMFFPEKTVDRIKELSVREDATEYMVLLTCFFILLYRYTGNTVLQVGSPIAGRTHVELESQIGTFVNTLVMRARVDGDLSFSDFLKRVKQSAIDAYAHQDLPFEVLVDALQPVRDMSHTPIIQVLFNMANAPVKDNFHPEMDMDFFEVDKIGAQFDLTLNVEIEFKKAVNLVYNTDLFDRSTAERMLKHYVRILGQVARNPGIKISDIDMLDAAEKKTVLQEWNETFSDYPSDRIFTELFEEQAMRTPDSVAVRYRDVKISYALLHERSNQLASYLQSAGVGPDVFVGVYMNRSIDMVISLLAVMKAGGAYLPLDPNYPMDRLLFYLEDSGAKIVLTESRYREDLDSRGIAAVSVDSDKEMIGKAGTYSPEKSASPDSLAYIIYTSGSTGKPKGVQIPHRALVNFLFSMMDRPGMNVDDILLSVTSISFDIQGLELYLPLLAGAQVVIASAEEAVDGRKLAKIIDSFGITVMQATPATWRLMLDAGWSSERKIKILCGGEAFPPDLAGKLLQRSTGIWNMYGPTETTIWSTVYCIESADAPILIGKPIANTRIYILDKKLKPVPVGVSGHLYIGGDGLARGYFNRPELTSEKFINDPFLQKHPGQRIYDTGDLARYRVDGNIECLGRSDDQVKLRGFRIELGEVESAMDAFEGVRQAVAVVREDNPGNQQLAAYIVSEPGHGAVINVNELRVFMKKSLPDYMIPNSFTFIEKMPLTPNGKVDRRSLPVPEGGALRRTSVYAPPGNSLEETVAAIWQQVLDVEKLGIYDNFFDLGGHSLLATQLISRIKNTLGHDVPLRLLFQNPTVSGFSNAICAEIKKAGSIAKTRFESSRFSMLFPVQPSGERFPFYMVAGAHQNRYYYLGKDQMKTSYEEDFLRYLANIIPFLGTDQPLYGFRPLGLFTGEKRHLSVEHMAREYVSELRKFQPEGPYFLGGECVGGIVAYEMAQQLMSDDQDVGLLVLFDTDYPSTRALINSEIAYLKRCVKHFFTARAMRSLSDIKNTLKAVLTREKNGFGRPELLDHYYQSTLLNYKPKPYPGDITLIVNTEYHKVNPSLGWDKITGCLDVHTVPGNHMTRLSVYGKETGAELRMCIDMAMKKKGIL